MLRKFARLLWGVLSRLIIAKHRPQIVAITGGGPNSVIREMVFTVINAVEPARRNAESPEAEFSIPLAVAGQYNYPDNLFSWIWCVIKVCGQLLWFKPYKHWLILEIDSINSDVRDFWLQTLKPEFVLSTGKVPPDLAACKNFVLKQAANWDIDSEIAEVVLSDFQLPSGRIRMLPNHGDIQILDATHFYFPGSLAAVREIVMAGSFRRVAILTDLTNDLNYLKSQPDLGWQLNPDVQALQAATPELLILRGARTQVWPHYQQIISQL